MQDHAVVRSSESEALRRRSRTRSGRSTAVATKSRRAVREPVRGGCRQRPRSLRTAHLESALPDLGERWVMLRTANAPGRCAPPALDLLSAFIADTDRARALARTRLEKNPDDEAALFLLGKIDLNYVWLQLGTRGRKTGWDEYWEARRLWTECSNAILAISARASRVRGLTTSSARRCPEAHAGCSVAAARRRGCGWFARPPAARVTSSSAQRRRLPSGTCRSARGTGGGGRDSPAARTRLSRQPRADQIPERSPGAK